MDEEAVARQNASLEGKLAVLERMEREQKADITRQHSVKLGMVDGVMERQKEQILSKNANLTEEEQLSGQTVI